MKKRISTKMPELLAKHRADVIMDLGTTAFDVLTPHEAARAIGIETGRLPELIRQGWLEPVPDKDIGRAHQYYRWRAEFVKRYKKMRGADLAIPS